MGWFNHQPKNHGKTHQTQWALKKSSCQEILLAPGGANSKGAATLLRELRGRGPKVWWNVKNG